MITYQEINEFASDLVERAMGAPNKAEFAAECAEQYDKAVEAAGGIGPFMDDFTTEERALLFEFENKRSKAIRNQSLKEAAMFAEIDPTLALQSIISFEDVTAVVEMQVYLRVKDSRLPNPKSGE